MIGASPARLAPLRRLLARARSARPPRRPGGGAPSRAAPTALVLLGPPLLQVPHQIGVPADVLAADVNLWHSVVFDAFVPVPPEQILRHVAVLAHAPAATHDRARLHARSSSL